MGNNESLPPPPPPGQPTVPPLAPPASQPPPPPTYTPPTGQFPPTQQFPPTSPFPGGPPGGFPPNASTAFEQPGEPPKRNTGLIIGGGLAAAAVIVAGVLVVTGRSDDKSVAPNTPPVNTVVVTIPVITMPPENTLVITVPVITESDVTEPPVTEPDVTDPVVPSTLVSGGEITDDLGVYSIVLPEGLDVDTTPVTTKDNFTLASVAGAADLRGFYSDDVTPGITSLVVGEDVESTPVDVLAFLDPVEGTCTSREQVDSYPTAIGDSILLKLDGCGDGTAAKVILVAAITGTAAIVALYAQGPGASADLLPQAQMVFETIRLL